MNLVRISPRRNTGISQVKTEQFLKAHQGESLEELQTQLDRILKAPIAASSDRMSYGLLRNQVEYLLGFPGRLAEIQAQAEHMSSVSIFAGSPYSQANIRKTAADYRRLEGAEVTLGHDRAVEQVMGARLSDWLLGGIHGPGGGFVPGGTEAGPVDHGLRQSRRPFGPACLAAGEPWRWGRSWAPPSSPARS